MAAIGEMIVAAGRISIGMARNLLHGVEPGSAGRLACPGGKPVESNHPAWAYGHLALYAPRLVELVGGDTSELKLPEAFEPLFKAGSTCMDDPKGLIYPPIEVITECFFKGYNAASAAVARAPDATFSQEMPEDRRSFVPTVGAAATFLLCSHIMMHMGQVSAWRRMMGLPPASLS